VLLVGDLELVDHNEGPVAFPVLQVDPELNRVLVGQEEDGLQAQPELTGGLAKSGPVIRPVAKEAVGFVDLEVSPPLDHRPSSPHALHVAKDFLLLAADGSAVDAAPLVALLQNVPTRSHSGVRLIR